MYRTISFIVLLFSLNMFSQKSMLMDDSGVISQSDKNTIENILINHEKKTSVEIGIIVTKTLDNMGMDYFKYQKFNELGIGKQGANNGLLFVFAIDDRESGVEIGDGLIALVTSPKSKEYLDMIIPYFRQEQYGQGIIHMLNKVTSDITPATLQEIKLWEKEQQLIKEKKRQEFKESFFIAMSWTIYVFLTIGFVYMVVYYSIKRYKTIKEIKEAKDIIKNLKLEINEEYKDDIREKFPSNIHEEASKAKVNRLMDLYNESSNYDNTLSNINTLQGTIAKLKEILFLIKSTKKDIEGSIKYVTGSINGVAKYENKLVFNDLIPKLNETKNSNGVLNKGLRLENSVFDKLESSINDFLDKYNQTDFSYKTYDELIVVLNKIDLLDYEYNCLIEDISNVSKKINFYINEYAHYSDVSLYKGLIDTLSVYAHRRGEKNGFSGIIQSLERCSKTKLNFHSSEYAITLKSLKSIENTANNMISAYMEDIEREEDIKRKKRAEEERIKKEERERKEKEEREKREKKRRKEEEERRRRNSSSSGFGSSSSSSSGFGSSSSSSSGFGGFGGGSSSGFGSKSGW